MAENLDETQEPQEPTLNENNEIHLEIIDAGDISTVYSSEAKPVLNIKWDLENPLASETGLVSEAGIGKVSNTLVAGGFRRSEIDNIIGKNTSVFVSNVTTELYGNSSNAANQISTQTPRPLLARKRLIRIIDIWNRIIFGMNINARDNASLNRFFGANLQTNADVLFRNQISHTVSGSTFNETNSWTWLVNPDPSFIFSQVSRFLYACIFEIKEKLKLLNTIVEGAESNLDIESLGINNNTDTFNIQDNFDIPYTSLLEPVHIIPDITHKVWNWSVPPTNANSKFQLLGAFAKHIPQKYSIMLFEPNFLIMLQELIDIIMDMPEEEHFSEIFKDIYINPKDVRLIEVLVKELVVEGTEGPTSESKIDFDSVHFTGIESIQNEPTKTSHIQFNWIYNFYLKHKNDFDFINETNAYNIKKKKYRYYEDIRVWDEQRKLRKDWEDQKWVYEESVEKDLEPVIGNLLVEYPLDVPNPENPESIPGPFVAGTVYVDEKHKNINHDPFLKYGNIQKTPPLQESDTDLILGDFQKFTITFNGVTYDFLGSVSFIKTTFKDGFKIHAFNYGSSVTYDYRTFIFDKDFNCVNVLTTRWLIQDTNFSHVQIGNKIIFHNPISSGGSSYDDRRYTSTCEIDDNGDLVNFNTTYYKSYNEPLQKSRWDFKKSVVIGNFIYVLAGGYIQKFEFDNNLNIISYDPYYRSGFSVGNNLFYHNGYLYDVGAMNNDRNSKSIRVLNNNELSTTINSTPMVFPDARNSTRYSGLFVDKDKIYCKYYTGNNQNITLVSYNISDGILSNRQEIKNIPLNNDDIDYSILHGIGEMFGDNLLVANNYVRYFAVCKINRNNIPTNNNEYFIERKTYQGPTKPLPEVANWANTRNELPELRKYDFVDEPFMDNHLPYKDNPQYKFPINKNTEQIKALNTRFANWVKLQKESYTNLDKLLTIFEYCSDLTSNVRYRARWDHGKTKKAGATHYDIGNRLDNILALNISKLSTRLGIEYFKSLDTYNKKVENKELEPNSPKPKPFFKNKVFSTEIYSGLNGSTTERNWRFGWSIVKFPKKFEIAPKIDETEATIVDGEKYIPCSWFSSGSSEILFPRQFIDTTDEDDEMYIGFYNACTSFGVTAQMEELFRQHYPLLTGTEKMHGTSLVTINTLKPQIHANFFKLAFIGDSTGKYFPDSQEELDVSPYGIDREAITKADIFVNIKADDDYLNKDEKFIESMDDEFDKPFIDSFKNIKIFYKLN